MIILLYKIGKSTVYFLFLFLFLFLHLQRIIFAHPIEVQNTSILDFNRVCKKINYLPVLPVATSSSSSYQYATSTLPVVYQYARFRQKWDRAKRLKNRGLKNHFWRNPRFRYQ